MLDNKTLLSDLRSRAEEIGADIIAWRRCFHAIPELRMETPQTEAQIVKLLRSFGITQIRSGVGGHGVCALIEGALPGKCLGIRADCDGLPIQEETGLPFASTNGNMHACGHDAHTAMALGAAKLLMEQRHLLKGNVKFIFQPYEEGDGGAKLMIADGALEDPKVDAIIGLHNHCTPDADYRPGDALVTDEPVSANIFAYEAVFHGKTSHICLSNETPNAVYMACDAVSRIASVPRPDSHTINAVAMIHGGVRNNIIPESCSIAGSVRSFDDKTMEHMKQTLFDILQDSAKRFGGTVEINTTIDLMGTRIDPALCQAFCRAADRLFPERGWVRLKDRELIGEDFARFAHRVPGLYFKLHTKPADSCYPLHHPKFDVDESVLYKGSALFAGFALTWQENESERG